MQEQQADKSNMESRIFRTPGTNSLSRKHRKSFKACINNFEVGSVFEARVVGHTETIVHSIQSLED